MRYITVLLFTIGDTPRPSTEEKPPFFSPFRNFPCETQIWLLIFVRTFLITILIPLPMPLAHNRTHLQEEIVIKRLWAKTHYILYKCFSHQLFWHHVNQSMVEHDLPIRFSLCVAANLEKTFFQFGLAKCVRAYKGQISNKNLSNPLYICKWL